MTRTAKDPNAPTMLFGESGKSYWLRLIEWVVNDKPGLTYDGIAHEIAKHSQGKHLSVVSVVRYVKILVERGDIVSSPDEEDHRRLLWSPPTPEPRTR